MLTPVHYRRKSARPVSCYALFKWWLLLSQHPGCLSKLTSLVTEHYLGTLDGGLGCFPFDRAAYPTRTDCQGTYNGIRSLAQWGTPGRAPIQISVSTPVILFTRRYPKRYFAENELSPSLIRLSLLPTSHPLSFQPKWVRSSTQYNPRFNLLMGRSLGFASAAYDNVRAINTRFP